MDPVWQRRGIGARLLVEVARLANVLDADEIVLTTRAGNQAVLPMVLAAGMIATTALPAYAYGVGGSFDPQASSTSFGEEQTLQIPNATAILTVSRDGYVAPTPEELASAQQAA